MGVHNRASNGGKKIEPSQKIGSGKRKKVFAESLGTAHLVELSNSIANSHSNTLKERVEKAKSKAAWQKEKRVQKMKDQFGSQDKGSATSEELKGKKVPMSKSSIRASLIQKQREKTKRRKEARKVMTSTSLIEQDGVEPSSINSDSQLDKPKKKAVAFA